MLPDPEICCNSHPDILRRLQPALQIPYCRRRVVKEHVCAIASTRRWVDCSGGNKTRLQDPQPLGNTVEFFRVSQLTVTFGQLGESS